MPRLLLIALSAILLHEHFTLLLGQNGRASITGIVHDPAEPLSPASPLKPGMLQTGVLDEASSNEVAPTLWARSRSVSTPSPSPLPASKS